MVTTYGVAVPAGVLVPGMLVGCSLGLLYLEMMLAGFNMSYVRTGGQSYLLIGASAVVAGYTRLTYSLAVIMFEATQSINLYPAVLISIWVSHYVGQLFNRSLYELSFKAKEMPFFHKALPQATRDIRIRQLIDERFHGSQNLEVVESVCTVERLIEILANPFSTIPVVNMHGSLLGLVPKHFIIVLIENFIWYEHETTVEGTDINASFNSFLQRNSKSDLD